MAVTWKQVPWSDEVAALTATAPVNVTKAAAEVGVGVSAARHDHKHDITTAVTGAVTGAASAEGSATSLARSDHQHAIGPLVADLDFDGNNALNLVLEVSASPPATPVVGKLYWDSDDNHIYGCTSAA